MPSLMVWVVSPWWCGGLSEMDYVVSSWMDYAVPSLLCMGGYHII